MFTVCGACRDLWLTGDSMAIGLENGSVELHVVENGLISEDKGTRP